MVLRLFIPPVSLGHGVLIHLELHSGNLIWYLCLKRPLNHLQMFKQYHVKPPDGRGSFVSNKKSCLS